MQAVHQQYLEQLHLEKAEVARLLKALMHEHEVLVQRDTDAIAAVVAEKEASLGRLNELAAERAMLLRQAGYNDDKSGFNAFLDTDESGQLAQQWRELEEGLLDCQKQNQVNGILLESSRQQAEQLLSLILGQSENKTELYDENGTSKSSYGQNTSIKV